MGDLEHSRKMHRRCQEELESSKTTIYQGKERERKLDLEKNALSSQLKATKESVSSAWR